jgi:hypothetical protein
MCDPSSGLLFDSIPRGRRERERERERESKTRRKLQRERERKREREQLEWQRDDRARTPLCERTPR